MTDNAEKLNYLKHSLVICDSGFQFQCPHTNDCQNNRCLWKWRDCHGIKIMVAMMEPKWTQQRIVWRQLEDKYGEPYYPELEYCIVANGLMVVCPDKE